MQKKKLKPEKLSQGVCTNTACVSKAVPSISNLPEEHPQAAAGTASAQLLLPHQGDSRLEPSSSVPWDEQCSAPPCPNSHSAELTAASWQETWVVFFFPSFYSSPPGWCCIYSSSGAARGRVPRSTAAWPVQPSWHRAAPGSHWPSASHSQSDQWALMP